MKLRGKDLVCFLLFCSSSAAWPQAPAIQNIDPPNWFVKLPEPMLLIHGSGLTGARFTIHARGVTPGRTRVSGNGHWAFVWLRTEGAPPQQIEITAATAKGRASHSWSLLARKEAAEAHQGFSSKDLIYLVMTDRFADGNPANDQPATGREGIDRARPRGWHGGDFAGIAQHLEYLHSLGVTALWTTPVYDNGAMPESYHGYAATNLYDVDPHFGTLDDYRHLSDSLHARNIKLMIDLVPNHIGVLHPWVKDPPTPDWFHGTLAKHMHAESNFEDLVDPHAAPRTYSHVTQGWFTDSMPDLNQENPLVATYLIQNALWWVETARIDAVRIDTFPYVGRAFWQAFDGALHQAYPRLKTVGETFYPDPRITSFFAGGRSHEGIDTGLDTPFDFPVYFTVRDVLAHDKPMTELAATLRMDSLYPHPERLVHFFGNHDTTRFLTEAHGSFPRLKEALGLLATLRGTPELYSGDEIGMTGGGDPENRHDFPGGFASASGSNEPSAFSASGRSTEELAIFAWTSELFAARQAHPVLQDGAQQNLFADDTGFAFVRSSHLSGCTAAHDREAVLVVINKKPEAREVILPAADTALAGCDRFLPLAPASDGSTGEVDGGVRVSVPADSFALFSVY